MVSSEALRRCAGWRRIRCDATSTETPLTRIANVVRPAGTCCPVVELRQYTLHPGTRDTLIAIFDREFVEPQEAVGIRVIGQFRDLDRPDVFTWLRGFADMPSRAAALAAFYDGPVWHAHRDAANATMITFDNVRLLRPASPATGFSLAADRRATSDGAAPGSLVVATIYTLAPHAAPRFATHFASAIAPAVAAAGGELLALLETEPSANTFPRLPVREGECSVVWLARFADPDAYDRHVAERANQHEWRDIIEPLLYQSLAAQPEVWRLVPTVRSLLR